MTAHDVWLEHAGFRFAHRVIENPESGHEPTLFVGGAFQKMDAWARFVDVFAPWMPVMLVDLPGMGESGVLPEDFGIDVLAGCIEQVLDFNEIARTHIVAASYGTPAAFRFAQLHPRRVGRVALAGTMPEIPPHMREPVAATIESALSGDRERLAGQVVEGMLCRDPALPIDRRELAARVLRSSVTTMSDAELRQYAANTARLLRHPGVDLTERIAGPEALVFTGEHDCFTLPADCRAVGTAFSSAWFTTVDRADHLFHVEQFPVVSALLLRFVLGRIETESSPGCATPVRVGAAHADAGPVDEVRNGDEPDGLERDAALVGPA